MRTIAKTNTMDYLRAQQAYANNVLQSKGYITLNEVYDIIGIPKSVIEEFHMANNVKDLYGLYEGD